VAIFLKKQPYFRKIARKIDKIGLKIFIFQFMARFFSSWPNFFLTVLAEESWRDLAAVRVNPVGEKWTSGNVVFHTFSLMNSGDMPTVVVILA
jgi:hypothetical protein